MNVFLLIASALFALALPPIAENAPREEIRILPVSKTPEPNVVSLSLSVPRSGDVKNNPLWVQFRLDGYPLGTRSQFDRTREIASSPLGQSIHVIVDDLSYFPVNTPAIDPFHEEGFYSNRSYTFELPYRLAEGLHTLRMFPARSYGESLKGENTFAALSFFIGKKEGTIDWSAPYLTYNEPSTLIPLSEKQPVLLDFIIKNCELSKDGYKILLTIDEKIERKLTSWQPYYIYGLKKGSHTVRLSLIDAQGAIVPGPFNDVERTITIEM